MKSREKLERLQLSDHGFGFDPATGLTYTLSSSSLRVLAWLKEGCPEEELAARLVAEYDAASHTAKRDVDSFLSTLRAYKLL